MRAIAVFHDHGNHWLAGLLKPGFRHVFVCVASEGMWIRVDGMTGVPVIEPVCADTFDLAKFYRDRGFTTVETETRAQAPRGPVILANCVGMSKTVLGIRAPLKWTPWSLYRLLTRN